MCARNAFPSTSCRGSASSRSASSKNLALTCCGVEPRPYRGTDFVVHDSHIYDGVDEREAARSLTLEAKATDEEHMQYIVTINTAAQRGFTPEPARPQPPPHRRRKGRPPRRSPKSRRPRIATSHNARPATLFSLRLRPGRRRRDLPSLPTCPGAGQSRQNARRPRGAGPCPPSNAPGMHLSAPV
ncbi:DUF2326 domain-containing protein [Streptomyces sp. NPDC003757]